MNVADCNGDGWLSTSRVCRLLLPRVVLSTPDLLLRLDLSILRAVTCFQFRFNLHQTCIYLNLDHMAIT